MPDNKKTLYVDKIRTDEICGIDGGSVNICGFSASNQTIVNLSGHYITGANLFISGAGNESIVYAESGDFNRLDVQSGSFDEVSIGGIKYTPRDRIAYAFRFGGPPVKVPSRLPNITGSNLYTGLKSGTNYIFVESTQSFELHDDIIINPGGLYGDGNKQEELHISGLGYFTGEANCCNAQINGMASAGTANVTYYSSGASSKEGYDFTKGDRVIIKNETYEVKSSATSSSETNQMVIDPDLKDSLDEGDCVCLASPILLTSGNLSNGHISGTYMANRYPARVKKISSTDYNVSVINRQSDPVTTEIYDQQYNKTVLIIKSSGVTDGSTTFSDLSPKEQAITATESRTSVGTDSPSYITDSTAPGGNSMSIEFNANNHEVLKVGSVSSDNWKFGNGDWTIESYVYPQANPLLAGGINQSKNYGTLFSKWQGGSNENTFLIHFDLESSSGSRVYAWFHNTTTDNSGRGVELNGNTVVPLNKWTHIAIQRRGDLIELYINGQLDNSVEFTGELINFTTGNDFQIGDFGAALDDNQTPLPFHGRMDEIRITKGKARYNSLGFTPKLIVTKQLTDTAREKYIIDDNCPGSTCYDTQYLYVDKGTYDPKPISNWYLTGYRDWFVDFEGVGVHITGESKTGLLTINYPDGGF